jgi:hypothetical protein
VLQTIDQYHFQENKPQTVVKGESPSPVFIKEDKKPVQKTVFFVYPERSEYGTTDFDTIITLKGKQVRVICENGIIKTSNPDLIEYYKSKKYEIQKED